MGCKSSSGDNSKTINTNLKLTQVPSVDQVLEQAKEFLTNAENFRCSLDEPREKMMEISNANILQHPRLLDCVQAWLTACASCGVNLDENVKITMEDPYVEADLSSGNEECKNFKQQLIAFLENNQAAPEKSKQLIEQGQQVANTLQEKVKTIKEDAKEANLNAKDLLGASSNLQFDIKQLINGITKLKQIQECTQSTISDITEMSKNMPNLIKECHANSEKAKEQSKNTPAQCIEFSNQPKKCAKDIEKMANQKKKSKAKSSAQSQEQEVANEQKN